MNWLRKWYKRRKEYNRVEFRRHLRLGCVECSLSTKHPSRYNKSISRGIKV